MDPTRRTFVKNTGMVGAAALAGGPSLIGRVWSPAAAPATRMIQTPVLDIGYEESGDAAGFPVILLHGFPYDAHVYDDVAPILAKAGYRALIPYLRGYGPTRFRDPAAPRTAEQAAIGQDVIDFADALKLDRFAVAGFDWGNRAACVAAALHPDRVRASVHMGGYSIQNTVDTPPVPSASDARRMWYQWYFNAEEGRAGLEQNRRGVCKLLWEEWNPEWSPRDRDEAFERTAPSFDNPDFVEVVLHSYRHRHLNAPGEPRFLDTERKLAKRPPIRVPSILLSGGSGPGAESPSEAERAVFPGVVEKRNVRAGHNMPGERPEAVAAAVIDLLASSTS